MKYKFFIILLFTGCLNVLAQNSPVRKNTIKVNVLSPIFNTLNLSYQHLFNNSRSLNLGFSYMDFDNFNNYPDNNTPPYSSTNDKDQTQGVAATAEFRIHFSDNSLEGWYGAPFIRYMNYTRNLNDYYTEYNPVTGYSSAYAKQKDTYQSAGLGFIVGYQFIIRNTVSIDFFGGPVYQIMLQHSRTLSSSKVLDDKNKLSDAIPNQYMEGYGLRGGITIGMCF
jgi:hypothetical protein